MMGVILCRGVDRGDVSDKPDHKERRPAKGHKEKSKQRLGWLIDFLINPGP